MFWHFIFFSYLCKFFWFRSSMDRISDSGSDDSGSNPLGITRIENAVVSICLGLIGVGWAF